MKKGPAAKATSSVNIRVPLDLKIRIQSLCQRIRLNTGILGREALEDMVERCERDEQFALKLRK